MQDETIKMKTENVSDADIPDPDDGDKCTCGKDEECSNCPETVPEAELPVYLCHKKVRALQIVDIGVPKDSEDQSRILVFGSEYPAKGVPADYVYKHKPKAGGYYVVYDDGYESFSPAEAFEDGYSLLPTPREGKQIAPTSLVNKRRRLRQAVIEAAKAIHMGAWDKKLKREQVKVLLDTHNEAIEDLMDHEEKAADRYDELSFPAIETP